MWYQPPTDDFVNFIVALTSSTTSAIASSGTATTSSTIATTSVSSDNLTPTPTSNPQTGSGFSTAVIGAIIGAVLGGVLLISYVAFIIIYKRRGRTVGAEKLTGDTSLEMTSKENVVQTVDGEQQQRLRNSRSFQSDRPEATRFP